jgi:release factor glutamine methyltransferase
MNNVTVGEALLQARKRLSPNSSTAQLDAEVLLAHVLGTGRATLLARTADTLGPEEARAFEELAERRTKGEPVAYITGHKEFYGLDLLITRDVLVPRPETESVVEACLEVLSRSEVSQLADIGTGSGAILVAVLADRPLITGFGTEISPEALEVARRNCARHGVLDRATLLLGDLLEPLRGRVNVIAANLPYVSPGEASPDVATWEPNVAVFGGDEDGAATIRRFLQMAPDYLLPGGTVVMETAYSQGRAVSELARAAFPGASVEVRKDLAGYDRIVVVKTK